MHGAIAAVAEDVTRKHVLALARTRHATAQRLGATPTGFYADAAGRIRSVADGVDATVILDHPGFANARQDVEIRPRNAKMLTLPISAASYGKRARAFSDLFVKRDRKTGRVFLVRRKAGKKLERLFLLLKVVRKRRDDTLLPSEATLRDAAADGVRGMMRHQVSRLT